MSRPDNAVPRILLVEDSTVDAMLKIEGTGTGAINAGVLLQANDVTGPSQFRGTFDCSESAALHSYGLVSHCR